MNRELILRGDFVGIFTKENPTQDIKHFSFSQIHWTYVKITSIESVEADSIDNFKAGDYYFKPEIKRKKRGFMSFWINRNRTEVFIPKTNTVAYDGDLHNVVFREFKKTDSGLIDLIKISDSEKGLWQCQGKIYFSKQIIEVSQPVTAKTNPEPPKSNGSINGSNFGRTGILQGISKLNDILVGTSVSVSDNPNKSAQSTLGTIFKWIMKLLKFAINSLIIMFLIATLVYLYHTNRTLFFIVLGFTLLYLISKFKGLNLSNWIGWIILVYLAYFFFKNQEVVKSDIQDTRKEDGSVKIKPPIKVEDDRDGATEDNIIPKEVNWWDFINNKFGILYNTSSQSFMEANRDHEKIKSISSNADPYDYYRKVYNVMISADERRIDSIAKLLALQSKQKKLNRIETAEMVTTFIQEIPYYLVHENSCKQAVSEAKQSGSDFIVEYHESNKPCLPNISAGIQTPYEFIHNLKGDCDTRALFGHVILTKLGIPSSVWISKDYSHSILGVGVPVLSGSFKTIDGVKHYAVELTAKGYRLGMISPQHRNMSLWYITNYKN
jgi:hypothetical protein